MLWRRDLRFLDATALFYAVPMTRLVSQRERERAAGLDAPTAAGPRAAPCPPAARWRASAGRHRHARRRALTTSLPPFLLQLLNKFLMLAKERGDAAAAAAAAAAQLEGGSQ